jgi:hypothetical protein
MTVMLAAVGRNVTPYPVAYRIGNRPKWADYSLARGASRWQLVMHEWAGRAAAFFERRRW